MATPLKIGLQLAWKNRDLSRTTLAEHSRATASLDYESNSLAYVGHMLSDMKPLPFIINESYFWYVSRYKIV